MSDAFNIGELAGALNLDDSQFREALARSAEASRVFSVDVGTHRWQQHPRSLVKSLSTLVSVLNNFKVG
jgi:hypothetical protein